MRWSEVIASGIVAVPSLIAALAAWRQARAANRAVNHRGDDQPDLYGMVSELRQWFDQPGPEASHRTIPTRLDQMERWSDDHEAHDADRFDRLHQRMDEHLDARRA